MGTGTEVGGSDRVSGPRVESDGEGWRPPEISGGQREFSSHLERQKASYLNFFLVMFVLTRPE